MPKSATVQAHRWRGATTAFLLIATSCTQLPTTSSVAIPPVSPSTARIWIYRNDAPNEPNQTPYVRLNGQIVGVVQPSGAFYRDVPPGYYTVAVDSYGAPYPHQFADFNLGAGQEAFVVVLSMREKVGTAEGLRTLFFTQLVSPDIARPAIARTPFYGGS